MAKRVPHVVVLGGGFGGLSVIRRLRRREVVLTVVDRCNYHLFQPLLYQVATAALSPADIAYPLRTIVRDAPRVRVLMAEVRDVDLSRRVVLLDRDEEEPYDYLIVALGATHAYFGHDEWADVAPGLKTIQDAIEIRGRFLKAFELAEREDDRVRRRALLTFAIIGAGPTGVELAGAMAEVARSVLKREFRHIHPETARIILIEAAERVLGPYPEELSARARGQLERLGVEVMTGAPVRSLEPGRVCIDD
ncbi:MAG: FAD-dependent oxidoreductase, partial [Armatimonadetes bacterium]|nr:FAD-dependent oxidoreductase [Armatimonadota bacterium]